MRIAYEDLAGLGVDLRQPPPRPLDWGLRWLIFKRWCLWSGFTVVGVLFAGLAVGLVALGVRLTLSQRELTRRGLLSPGTVLEKEPARSPLLPLEPRGRGYLTVRYHFRARGRLVEGAVSLPPGEARRVSAGAQVTVRYLPERPAVSRLEGFRGRSLSAELLLFGYLCAGLALPLLVAGLLPGVVVAGLVSRGAFARATVVEVEAVDLLEPGRKEDWRVRFEYLDGEGRSRAGEETLVGRRWSRPEVGSQVVILFDSRRPARRIVVGPAAGGGAAGGENER